MTAQAARPQVFPRLPLLCAAGLLGFTVLGALAGHLTGAGSMQPTATMVAERTLRFTDRADGAVVVINEDTGKPVEVLTGQNGFLRGTLRGFARTRHMDHLDDEPPFKLSSWSDGRLMLVDPSTGRYVDLEAFGQTNEAVFGHLLSPALYKS